MQAFRAGTKKKGIPAYFDNAFHKLRRELEQYQATLDVLLGCCIHFLINDHVPKSLSTCKS